MKQRILVAVASLVLSALLLLLLPLGTPTTQQTTATTGTTPPTTATPPSTTIPPTQPSEPGIVRLYSCDPAIRAVLAGLAADYTTQTGTEVDILAPEEDGCQATLQRLLESEDPPTAFCVHSWQQLTHLEHTLLELKDTPLIALLRSEDMAIRVNGKLLAIPMGLQAYGLLYNAELTATALTRSDIVEYGFTSLSTAVQILKNNSIKAFPTPVPTAEDAWYLLALEEPVYARAFLDLYLTNYNKSGDPLTEFLNGKAAFLPGGSWNYELLASYTDRQFHVRNLDMVPTYVGGAMQYYCDWAWCINAGAREADIEATTNFFCWMATVGQNSTAPIDQLQILTPFASSGWYANQLEKKLLGYMSTENAIVDFSDIPAESEHLLTAMNTYLQAPTDENWEQLRLCMESARAQLIPE